jgi:hypothetical protein
MGFNQGKIKSGLSGSGWLRLAVVGVIRMEKLSTNLKLD